MNLEYANTFSFNGKEREENWMKRTRILKLSIMSASALTLIACERSQEVAIFESLEQCANQSIFSQEECSKSERLARSEHIRVSPKYSSVADCERDFGEKKCEIDIVLSNV